MGKLKLRTKTGWSQIKCKSKPLCLQFLEGTCGDGENCHFAHGGEKCVAVRPSSQWSCRCRTPWIKCPRHIHEPAALFRGVKKVLSERKRLIPIYGTTKPLPAVKPKAGKKLKVGEERRRSPAPRVSGMSGDPVYASLGMKHCGNVHTILPGSGYARKFPQLVKTDALT